MVGIQYKVTMGLLTVLSDSQENGTCATIWPLWKAHPADMKLSALEEAFDHAPPLSLGDIILNHTESAFLRNCLIHCILRIIIDHGGEGMRKFHKELESSLPSTADKIEVHKTSLHPLPAMNIDESTITGNAEVVEAILSELKVKDLLAHAGLVKIFTGDQLSIARLHTLANIRAGQEGGFSGFGWGIWMPGLFHAKITDMHGFFTIHWGKPNTGTCNPGSLFFHNTRLFRHPITLSSLPPFRTCRDLVFVSLYSWVLHCLLLVSQQSSLFEYAKSVDSWEILKQHVEAIYDTYTDMEMVADLHWEHQMAREKDPMAKAGDMVYENALLFMQDALLSHEFTEAIKCGDSGRVIVILKVWALSFRGNGRTKYAFEMLHLIHNLSNVWPKGIRYADSLRNYAPRYLFDH